jgi:hypothetical protein
MKHCGVVQHSMQFVIVFARRRRNYHLLVNAGVPHHRLCFAKDFYTMEEKKQYEKTGECSPSEEIRSPSNVDAMTAKEQQPDEEHPASSNAQHHPVQCEIQTDRPALPAWKGQPNVPVLKGQTEVPVLILAATAKKSLAVSPRRSTEFNLGLQIAEETYPESVTQEDSLKHPEISQQREERAFASLKMTENAVVATVDKLWNTETDEATALVSQETNDEDDGLYSSSLPKKKRERSTLL